MAHDTGAAILPLMLRRMFSLILLPLILSHTTLFAQEANPVESKLDAINDAVSFLAGLEMPHQADHPLTKTAAWRSHVAQIGAEFTNHQERVLFPMSDWAASEVRPSLAPGGVVRYLFSGPDILHAFYLYPNAGTFLLCGLEPVGEAPDISLLNESNADLALTEVRNALSEIINFSFFRTKDMKDDLQFATFRGTTPLILIFLARSGQRIKGIEFLNLQKDGTLVSRGLAHAGADVVRVEFAPFRVSQTKTLYYFSSDLSDGGFVQSGLSTWLSHQAKGDAYVKAASYLMYNNWFSRVRQHLIDYSLQVVEDDSGIPYHYFDPADWQAHLYGVYTGAIDLFPNTYQTDLAQAYARGAQPLPFGTGYKWRKGESNLMRYLRRAIPPISTTAESLPSLAPLIAEPLPATVPVTDVSEIPQTTSGE